jgi:hypothetical protein
VDIGSDYHIRVSIDREQKQTRLISSRLLLDQHNKFNSLAEYLYKNGQAENPTLSTLLRVTIEHLLAKYHDVLEEYWNRTDCIKDKGYKLFNITILIIIIITTRTGNKRTIRIGHDAICE